MAGLAGLWRLAGRVFHPYTVVGGLLVLYGESGGVFSAARALGVDFIVVRSVLEDMEAEGLAVRSGGVWLPSERLAREVLETLNAVAWLSSLTSWSLLAYRGITARLVWDAKARAYRPAEGYPALFAHSHAAAALATAARHTGETGGADINIPPFTCTASRDKIACTVDRAQLLEHVRKTLGEEG